MSGVRVLRSGFAGNLCLDGYPVPMSSIEDSAGDADLSATGHNMLVLEVTAGRLAPTLLNSPFGDAVKDCLNVGEVETDDLPAVSA